MERYDNALLGGDGRCHVVSELGLNAGEFRDPLGDLSPMLIIVAFPPRI